MKIKLLGQNLNSTLSCILKCLRFFLVMINKKIIFGLFLISFLSGCSPPTAMLGPAYTLSSTGSAFQAGLNYGSNHLVTMYTGKTPVQNLQEISNNQKNKSQNIQKKTLQSDDFYFLVKKRVEEINKIIKKTNQ